MKKYLKVWFQLAHISFSEQITVGFAAILFLIGKIARFLLFFFFIFNLLDHTKGLAGYTKDQIITFFLVFNLVDVATQMLFRGVYYFRDQVVNGTFDFILAKPMSPLFRIMSRQTDFLDLLTLVALIVYFISFLAGSSIVLSPITILAMSVMLVASLAIALAFHIIVVSIGVLTTEVDNSIMVYRDLTQMARVPVDMYAEPVRVALTYFIPVALMITFPAKALMGLLSFPTLLLSLFLASCFLLLSLRFWKFSLSQYSSASS